MKTYDFTKQAWQEMLPNCADVCRLRYANDNQHEWWIHNDIINVPSLFDLVDYAALRRRTFEVVR